MKRNLFFVGTFLLAFVLLSSFSLRENPQDPPRGKKSEKHIKLVTVDDNGKKMELDTVVEDNNFFVWNGDTIGGEKEFKWVSNDDMDFDFDMDMDIDVKQSADGKIIIMKSGKGGAPIIHEFKMDGDSNKIVRLKMRKDFKDSDQNRMFWNDEGGNEMFFNAPHAPKMIRIEKNNQGNVIDLSDPGIISYDKKELKGGKEKITIIRNKPIEKEIELHQEIIMHGAEDGAMMLQKGHPVKSKTVKVISDDNGNITIYEDGKVKKTKAGGEKGTFVTDDGNVVRVKEIKEGDLKKVEVKVEVEEEKKDENKE